MATTTEETVNTVENPDSAVAPRYDVIVAGGGAAGALAAARIAAARPGAKILLIERDAMLGGRLRVSSAAARMHSFGLNAVSDTLFSFWDQTLKSTAPGAPELAAMVTGRQTKIGVLAGSSLTQADIDLWFTAKGARTLGGLTAARQWGEVEEIVRQGASKADAAMTDADDIDDEEALAAESDTDTGTKAPAAVGASAKSAQAFSHYWKKPRKVPAAVVLEHFGSAFGIPDIWGATVNAIGARAAFHAGRLHYGNWDQALSALVDPPNCHEQLTITTDNRIVDANFEDGVWHIEAEKGRYQGKALVVAQSPWQATGWLRRTCWPTQLLQIASKTKPVSIVVLSEPLLKPEIEIPDVILVPAERVQIVRNGAGEICFQATIDYEMSVQAPTVVKAVKSLKRARKKLLALFPGIVGETSHIAMQPVAWAQSPVQSDRRWLDRLGRKSFNTKVLAFCGDAYGPSYDGDTNLTRSVVSASEIIASGLVLAASLPSAAAPV